MIYNIMLFGESLEQLFLKQIDLIKTKLRAYSQDQILAMSESKLIAFLESEYLFDIPEINFDGVESLSEDPRYVTFHIPFTGNIQLLRYKSELEFNYGSRLTQLNFRSQPGEILITMNYSGNANRMEQEYLNFTYVFRQNYDFLRSDLTRKNESLKKVIAENLRRVKDEILNRRKVLSEMNIPVRISIEGSNSFSIPDPKLRKKILIDPSISTGKFVPEPFLNNEVYQEILKRIDDAGKNFERLPSIYDGKGEEDLRDFFLFHLDPQFEMGSATGETFNKTGKTDISLRYDSSIVFIAECKFWKGPKSLTATVDQLLGYLTWRDSKTSVIIFVQNVGMGDVVKQVTKTIQDHRCWIKNEAIVNDGWFNFIFCLPDDPNKEIKMAVQLYHIPPKKTAIE